MRMNREIDVRHVLSAIHVPTLILHRTAERLIDMEHARYLARHITRAKLVELSGEDHTPWFGDSEVILDERAASLGDRPWRELLEAFHAKVREVLRQYHGREINTSGDGFFAAFDGPARAIRCAGVIRNTLRSLNLDVRCGLHTGECERVGNDLAGIAVHIGARVADLAAPGEVLVSQTVRDLVAGSGLAFEDRGTHILKGVPNDWRLFSARIN